MRIPNKFKVGGGKEVIVNILNDLEDKFGDWSCAKNEIRIANIIKMEDGEVVNLTEEDKLRTFLHELIHCFQFYYNCTQDETQAQIYSNFLYEFLTTKE